METETKAELETDKKESNKLSIPMAIIVAGILIAGAVLLKGNTPIVSTNTSGNNGVTAVPAPVGKEDKTLGNPNAKVVIIMYEDFQCPFCGAISGLMGSDAPLMQALKQREPDWTPFMPEIINNYVKNGKVLFVYRDWAFLGQESIRAAIAARCAGDQDKFWEYHDYLYSHQNGENEGSFSDPNLKSFADKLGLNTTLFNQCFDANKYEQVVKNSRSEGTAAGVNGTPKGFILKEGKIVSTIDGAESLKTVKPKIENALK